MPNPPSNSQPELLPTQVEAAARLRFAIEHAQQLALLFGPAGSGKTRLLSHLERQCRREGRLTARVSLAGLTETEAVWNILAAWKMNPPADASLQLLWRKLGEQLRGLQWQSRRGVIFLDDLAAASPATLVALQRLFAFDAAAQSLTVIAAADSFSRSKLPRTWLELAELRADLEPLSEKETTAFVAEASSGGFTPEAATTLHSLTAGLPRQIDQLQKLVTIAASAAGESAIDAATVDQVYRELFVAPRS
jgi:type II secretory pathway predicted ATPase ExeA